MKSPALKVTGLYHGFGEKKVLNNINIEIKAGQIVAMVGPSGCGKSTLLNAILGTHPPITGTILANDKLIKGPTRNIGIVYQGYALYDFLNVRENVAFGLKVDQTSLPFRFFRPFKWHKLHKEHLEQADAMLAKVGLCGCADSLPKELSGGMRQRVAIAQSLIMKPAILLLDEPFGALDEATRESLQMMLLNLYQENIDAKKQGVRPPHTILIVTHELNEALYVSDRVVGLSQYYSGGAEKGATIVYDQPTPVFRPNDPKDFSRFEREKNDIRNVVYSNTQKSDYEKYLTKWTESTIECLPGDPNLSLERV